VRRLFKLPVLVFALTLAAIAVMGVLGNHADASRKAQLQVSSLKLDLTDLVATPFNTDLIAGSSSARARALSEIRVDEGVLFRGLAHGSGAQVSLASSIAANSDLARIKSAVAAVYAITTQPVGVSVGRQIRSLQADLTAHTQRLFSVLNQIDRSDAGQAHLARVEAEVGSALAMLTLVGVFMIFYLRSLRTQRENAKLLSTSRIEASTDALTGLGNRRALLENLTRAISSPQREAELLLAIFDLNGFKQYNDTFGHGAGDALLVRIGRRLAAATAPAGSAYRMGGDEFCLLARCTPQAADGLLVAAITALSDYEDGSSIDCSHGAAWIPSEATTANDALQIADQRMYADKASAYPTNQQLINATPVLSEHDEHLDGRPRREVAPVAVEFR
jgi:diguanylate cyclase (GGDEF)-like protein